MLKSDSQRLADLKVVATVALVLLGISLFATYVKQSEKQLWQILPFVSAGLLLFSLLIPAFAYWFAKGWMKLGVALGWINSKVLLTIIFFVFLTPIAFFYRLSNKNPLKLKAPENTNWEERNHQYTPKDLDKTW